MPRESTIQRKIQKLVRDRGGYALKVHGSEMQPAAVDLYICYRGLFIAIETKIPGETPTRMQEHIMHEIHKANGYAFVATSLVEVVQLLDDIDAVEDEHGFLEQFDLWYTRAAKS